MIKFCRSFTAVIIVPLSNFYSDSSYLIIYPPPSPTQSKRKWHVIIKQKELRYDCNSRLRWDPWMSIWEPPQLGRSLPWAAFSIHIKGEHGRGWRRWMSAGRIKVGDQTPSEGIGEWALGISNALPRLPLLFGWKLPPRSGCVSSRRRWLTRKEVASAISAGQIVLLLLTNLGPAAACVSACIRLSHLGSRYKI